MVWPERRLFDRQGATIQRLSAGVFGAFVQEHRYAVQVNCEVRIDAGGRLTVVQCAGVLGDLVVCVAKLHPVAQQLVLLRVRVKLHEHVQVDQAVFQTLGMVGSGQLPGEFVDLAGRQVAGREVVGQPSVGPMAVGIGG